jgi:hypothetical protein
MASLQNTSILGTLSYYRTENAQTANYILALSDHGRVVSFSGALGQTVTVPNDSTVNFPVGAVVYINKVGSGTVTLAAAGGVSLSKTGNLGSSEELYIRKRAANTWIVVDIPKNPSATTSGTVSQSSTGAYTVQTFTGAGSLTVQA